MLIFDSHLDLALNGVDWNRDLRQTVDDIRAQETSLEMEEKGRQTNTLSFPELRVSELAVCLTTLLARQEQPINHSFGWTSPHACYAMAHAHLAYYRALEEDGTLRMLRTSAELKSHFEAYRVEPKTTPLGFILTMEGADPILQPKTIFEFHEAGLRALGLTHYGTNRYGGGTRSEVGLSLDAIELLKYCQELAITIDMTHLGCLFSKFGRDTFDQNAKCACFLGCFRVGHQMFRIALHTVAAQRVNALWPQPDVSDGWYTCVNHGSNRARLLMPTFHLDRLALGSFHDRRSRFDGVSNTQLPDREW